jgi:hypothetical protein
LLRFICTEGESKEEIQLLGKRDLSAWKCPRVVEIRDIINSKNARPGDMEVVAAEDGSYGEGSDNKGVKL